MFIWICWDVDAFVFHIDVVVGPVGFEFVESDDDKTDTGEDNIDVVDSFESDGIF